jgi:2-iminobutanoate/2-iminopropanoate deaminase
VYVSGILPSGPDSTQVSGSVAEQTRLVLTRLDAILAAAGCSRRDVLKTTVYTPSVEHWPEINRVYAEFFAAHRPARTVVPVRELHYGAAIELDAVAYRGAAAG